MESEADGIKNLCPIINSKKTIWSRSPAASSEVKYMCLVFRLALFFIFLFFNATDLKRGPLLF